MKWKEMIKDEIEDYVKDVDFSTEPTAENKRVKVRDYGFSTK